MVKKAIAGLITRLPHSTALITACTLYINAKTGRNNPDGATNGESLVVKRFLPRCKVAFDIGANIGDWSRDALAVNPNLELHCFEPTPATHAKLLSRGWPGRVKVNRLALSDRQGTAQIHTYAHDGMNSLFRRDLAGSESDQPVLATETINLDTFDEYRKAHNIGRVDFVKIDVEGNEINVMRGMIESARTGNVGLIQFEYGGTYMDSGARLREAFSIFGPMGGRLYRITPGGPREQKSYSTEIEDFQYQNWLVRLPAADAIW
jgi:FkbM family methyltransferase